MEITLDNITELYNVYVYVTIIKKLFNLIQSSSYLYSHQRKFPLVPKPRCKNPRKKAFNHLDQQVLFSNND